MTSVDLTALTELVLAMRPTGADIEVCVRAERRQEVFVEGAGQHRTSNGDSVGVAVRVTRGRPSRMGFTATSDITPLGLREAVETAGQLAMLTEPGPELPEAVDGAVPETDARPPEMGMNLPAVIDELLSTAEGHGIRPVTATVLELEQRQEVRSSRGVAAAGARYLTRAHLTAQVTGQGGQPRQALGVRVDGKPNLALPGELAAALATDLLPQAALEPVAAPPGCRLLLAPLATAKLLRPLATALDGVAVRTGKSPVRLGSVLLPEWVDLVDDGRPEGGPLGAPADDEGVPTRRAVLVAGGEVVELLSRWESVRPGSGGQVRRFGWDKRPRTAAANLRLVAVAAAQPDNTGSFVRVLDITGIESSYDFVTGDFAGQVNGILCAGDGTPRGLVKDVLRGNIGRIFQRVSWVNAATEFFPLESAIGGCELLIEPPVAAGLSN